MKRDETATWLGTTAALVACALTPIGVSGCGSRNNLGGSVSRDFSLEFDEVEISILDETLIVDYVKDNGQLFGVSIPCRLALETGDVTVTLGTPIEESALLAALEIRRLAAFGGDFPSLRSANMTFSSFSVDAGQMVVGQFDAIFDDDREIRGLFAQRLREQVTP